MLPSSTVLGEQRAPSSFLRAGAESESAVYDPPDFLQNPLGIESIPPWELVDLSTNQGSDIGALESMIDLQTLEQPRPNVPGAEALESPVQPEDISEGTTLCSFAFSLVMKNNKKGYNTADLDLKLRAGYRSGATTSGGCRVDNKILFRVLAEIS
jgi:hypothetical protein